MKWLFWVSLAMILYPFAGYPAWLYLRSRFRPRPVKSATITPSLSLVVATWNDAKYLPRKLENLSHLEYPPEKLEAIFVSDGSTDETNEILAQNESQRVRPVLLPNHAGKAEALNAGVRTARGEIVVFTDARQIIEPEALLRMVSSFGDATVGSVSGELMLGDAMEPSQADGVGTYWRIEKAIRKMESETDSVVGATGAIYAVRRELIVPLPAGTILDDVYIPLAVARRGFRVTFEPTARAWDDWKPSLRQEFRRKVRTLAGNYQLLQLAPWLLTRQNPLRFELFSHKLSRLILPFALVAMFLATLLMPGRAFRAAAIGQFAFYCMAALPLNITAGFLRRIGNIARTFVILNAAAVVALISFLSGRKQVWIR